METIHLFGCAPLEAEYLRRADNKYYINKKEYRSNRYEYYATLVHLQEALWVPTSRFWVFQTVYSVYYEQ